MAKLEVKVSKAALGVRNVKDGSYKFDSVTVGEWSIPQQDEEDLVMEYLQFNSTKSLPIRISERSLGFIKIGKKHLSELMDPADTKIHPDDSITGTLVFKTVDKRTSVSITGLTALQLLG